MTNRYFGTDGIRGRVGGDCITPEFVLKLGWAAGRAFAEAGECKVLIGKDTRVSGYMLESALEAGLSAAGANILLLGPMPTPGIAYLTRTFRGQCGIVISASHNQYEDNGIKFFSAEGLKLSGELEQRIEHYIDEPMLTVPSFELGKAVRVDGACERYIEFCKSTVSAGMSFTGLKVVLDCANGATYHVAPSIFYEMGATIIETATSPDGFNINRHCGSTDVAHLQQIVLAKEADVGIAFDGDGDRVTMVDHQGEIVDGDELLYIMAMHHLLDGRHQSGVVGTIMSNFGLERALTDVNIPFMRTNVGDHNVIDALHEKDWLLGGEPSGHIIWRHATTTGDGIVCALQILATMLETGKTLHQLKSNMHKYPQVLLNVPTEHASDIIQTPAVQNAISETERRLANAGRLVLRPSGTEPMLRIMVEGEDGDLIVQLANELALTVNPGFS